MNNNDLNCLTNGKGTELLPGIVAFPVHGDGSCLFHSLAFIINVSKLRSNIQNRSRCQEIGLRMRKQIMNSAQWKRFGHVTGFTDFQPNIDNAKNPRYSAGEYIINFTARRLGLNILVCDETSSSKQTYIFPCQKPKRPFVCLRWIGRCHFEPIVEVDHQGRFEPQNLFKDRFLNANSRYIRGVLPKSSSLVSMMLKRT